MIKNDISVKQANILILGFTFKENCPDVRNTRVIDIVNTLQEYDTRLEVYDTWADPAEVDREYGFTTCNKYEQLTGVYDAIVLAVAHSNFSALDYKRLKSSEKAVVYDIKSFLSVNLVDARL